jgi:hypothetical protein
MFSGRSNNLRILGGSIGMGLLATAAVAMPAFDEWSAAADIETLPGSSSDLNSASIDGCASMSPDGLTLAFNSFRSGNQQIYLASRASKAEGFGDPVLLPSPINTPSLEACPTLARGNRLYLTSSRDDPGDLYLSRLGPKGWSEPERLGAEINNPGTVEESLTVYEDDEGREVRVFSRRPAGPLVGPGGKIYQSLDGAPATLVAGGPHSSSSDNRPSITHDGRTIMWDSLRAGPLAVYTATRSNRSESWGQAVQLTQLGAATRPSVSWDGEMLLLGVNSDVYFSSRSKVAAN